MANDDRKEEMVSRMQAEAPLNLEKSERIAAEFGVKSRSVIATAVRLGIAYEKKVRVSKNGKKPTNKTELVKEIAEALFVSTETLEGLEKSSKLALENVLAAIKNEESEEESSEEESSEEENNQ
jgi:hypothetical protein